MRLAESMVDPNEIIGTLVSHMRADIYYAYPDSPILQAAHEKGVSHLIKKCKAKEREYFDEDLDRMVTLRETEIEMHDSQAAAGKLVNVFGLQNLPAPNKKAFQDFDAKVDELIQRCADAGISLTRDQAAAKLKPIFGKLLPSDAVN